MSLTWTCVDLLKKHPFPARLTLCNPRGRCWGGDCAC
jgi:hypothetical protein